MEHNGDDEPYDYIPSFVFIGIIKKYFYDSTFSFSYFCIV